MCSGVSSCSSGEMGSTQGSLVKAGGDVVVVN